MVNGVNDVINGVENDLGINGTHTTTENTTTHTTENTANHTTEKTTENTTARKR